MTFLSLHSSKQGTRKCRRKGYWTTTHSVESYVNGGVDTLCIVYVTIASSPSACRCDGLVPNRWVGSCVEFRWSMRSFAWSMDDWPCDGELRILASCGTLTTPYEGYQMSGVKDWIAARFSASRSFPTADTVDGQAFRDCVKRKLGSHRNQATSASGSQNARGGVCDPNWEKTIAPPPVANVRRTSGTDEFSKFVHDGRLIAKRVSTHIREYVGEAGLSILDFGCGAGRVALPMYFEHGLVTHACDIDESATSYVSSVLPIDVRVTPFKPPLPYDDDTFDVVYSISIWTHLTIEDQISWLKEMRRIIKPGGYLMPSTSSYAAIKHRQKLKVATWMDVDPLDLRDAGYMYKESMTLKTHADIWFPGVTDSYGQTSNDTAHIINCWSDIFIIRRHFVSEIGGVQDMNILQNPK